MSQGTTHTEFHYGAGREKTLKRELAGSTVQSRTHYVGSVEVVWNGASPGAGSGQYRRAIAGVAIATWYASTGVHQKRYLHTDHLGSITAISNESGQVETWMGFDAWGQRRDADAWHPWQQPPAMYLNVMLAITPRGFTGHEHVDTAGIIHMNGRIYDPRLGRFLQADPFVEDTTTLNRYTYVHNNPLAYTDPSGYYSVGKFFKRNWRTIATIAVSVFAPYAGLGFWGTVGLGAGAGFITTGTIEGALIGAFTAGAFYGIGQWGRTWGEWAKGGYYGHSARGIAALSLAHGTAGGAVSLMQGGKFGHGFASAGVTKIFSPAISDGYGGNRAAQAATAAVVGGTVSRITGGKFANGAVTAAMAYAFNQLTSSAQESDDLVLDPDDEKLVVQAAANLPDPSAGGNEAWLSIDQSNAVSGVQTEGCTPNYCLVDPTGAKIIIHVHPVVDGDQATQLAREWPGPGDHRLVTERGVINVIRTPSGAIRAVERVDGNLRVRTIHGGGSRLNSHVERTWQPGMNDRQILRQAERFRR